MPIGDFFIFAVFKKQENKWVEISKSNRWESRLAACWCDSLCMSGWFYYQQGNLELLKWWGDGIIFLTSARKHQTITKNILEGYTLNIVLSDESRDLIFHKNIFVVSQLSTVLSRHQILVLGRISHHTSCKRKLLMLC